MRKAMIFVLASVLPAALAGQNPDHPSGRAPRRLSLVLELGGSVGGPGGGLAAQLRRAGFDDSSPVDCTFAPCTGPIDYPTQYGPGPASGLTARFAIGRTLDVGAGFGRTSLGGSVGYRAGGGLGFDDYIHSDWDARMVWAGVFWKPLVGLHLGGGPGWYQLEKGSEGVKISRVGLMGEVGVEVPADRRLFVNLAVRAHVIPARDVEHGTAPITLRPNWTHLALLAGLGIRL